MYINQFYPFIILIHILSSIVWLGFFPVEISIIKSIKREDNNDHRNLLISKLLSLTNLTGMIGFTGILLTGITLVIISPYYNFFEKKANHWLTTKQIIIILILLITFLIIIPLSKKIRNTIDENLDDKSFKKFIMWAYLEKILVLINFLLGFLHRFYF